MNHGRSALTGAILLALVVPTGGAKAETISYADAVTVLARDCGKDIKKYCKGVNIGNNAIADCLAKNQAKVSQVCTASLAAVVTSIKERQAAQASVAKVCLTDAKRWCEGVVRKESYTLDCLLKVKKRVTAKCNQAITDAGWR